MTFSLIRVSINFVCSTVIHTSNEWIHTLAPLWLYLVKIVDSDNRIITLVVNYNHHLSVKSISHTYAVFMYACICYQAGDCGDFHLKTVQIFPLASVSFDIRSRSVEYQERYLCICPMLHID